jgi:hypothetical protein
MKKASTAKPVGSIRAWLWFRPFFWHTMCIWQEQERQTLNTIFGLTTGFIHTMNALISVGNGFDFNHQSLAY